MGKVVFELYVLVALTVLLVVVEDRSVEKCSDKLDPDVFRNVSQLIRSRGYPVEEYSVVTEDHFVLGVQRIPHGRAERSRRDHKHVVFLQHGLLGDSSNWVQNYPDDSLGYILADNGYDVWLGNVRGNRYSRHNCHLEPCEPKFWDWSFQEMAAKDIPAMLEYALNITGETHLYYVGHSQGTLIGFIAFSTIPQIAKKVKLFFALAPIFYLNHTAQFCRDLACALQPYEFKAAQARIEIHVSTRSLDAYVNDYGYCLRVVTKKELFHPSGEWDFLPGRFLDFLLDIGFCEDNWSEKTCYHIAEFIFGYDDPNNNMSRVPVYLSNWPAGTSFKDILHFCQIILAGKCQMFNYGREGNLKHYHQDTPPVYDVTKMTTPTAFFYGGKDGLANATDVRALIPQIRNLIVEDFIRDFNHIDFVFGIDAGKVLYNRIVAIIETNLMN